jgi:hypothetical protein
MMAAEVEVKTDYSLAAIGRLAGRNELPIERKIGKI